MRNVYSFDSDLNLATGLQRVLTDIHFSIRDSFNAKILGTIDYENVNKSLGIPIGDYKRFNSIFELRNSVVIVHQRNAAVKLNLLNKFLFLNIHIVYVHHNLLKGQRYITFLPKNIITISDRCIYNLTNYFFVNKKKIYKIHNSVPDKFTEYTSSGDDKIKILYPGTIYPVKRQIELVKHLSNLLSENVKIYFAGIGEQYVKLQELVKYDNRFECLGFVNVAETLQTMDYCMLFSEYEGLPISLIEGCMMGKPIICNDVGGNTEIATNGYNGFVCNEWDELADILNNLPNMKSAKYISLSRNSRAHYLRYFTVDKFKNEYINYISKLV